MTRTELPNRPTERRLDRPDTRTIWRGATAIASVLVVTGVGLGLAQNLSLSALALLGGLSAGIAAVRERPHRRLGWLLVSVSGVALAVVLIASLVGRPGQYN